MRPGPIVVDEDFGKPVGRWLVRGAKTRWHTYYTPTTNLQGVLLFTLVGALGLVALIVGVRHGLQRHQLVHRDRVLCAIGAGCLLLGAWQTWKLAREKEGWDP